MHRVEVGRELAIPAATAWAKLDAFGDVYKINPFVVASRVTGNKPTGLGARRECVFEDGNRIVEEITEYRACESLTIEITDPGPFPLEVAVGSITVAGAGPERSRVTIELSFVPKYGPVGWLMAKFMMKREFRKRLAATLDGIEKHVRTGRAVGVIAEAQAA